MRKTISFQVPSRLNHYLEQLADLPLNVVAKCIEEGAEQLAGNDAAQLNEVGDGTHVEMKYDPRFGDLEEHLNTLAMRTNRPIQDLLPSIFAAGFAVMEPKYLDMLAKRTASKAAAENSDPFKGDGSTETN